jgi:hypothetical protein
MTDVLGIPATPEVVPFGNVPAFLAPFILAPDRAMVLPA